MSYEYIVKFLDQCFVLKTAISFFCCQDNLILTHRYGCFCFCSIAQGLVEIVLDVYQHSSGATV